MIYLNSLKLNNIDQNRMVIPFEKKSGLKNVSGEQNKSFRNYSIEHLKANYLTFSGGRNINKFPELEGSLYGLSDTVCISDAKNLLEQIKTDIIAPGSIQGLVIPNRAILLSGITGSGKTNLVKALAKDLKAKEVPVIRASSGSFEANETGDNIRNIDYLFDYAMEKAEQNPKKAAVIYLDNIEVLCPKEATTTNDEALKANKLMQRFKDNLERFIHNQDNELGNIKLYLVAETANEQNIEPDIFQNLQKVVVYSPRNKQERLAVLRNISDKYNFLYGPEAVKNEEYKQKILSDLAEGCLNCSVSDLERILVQANNYARTGKHHVPNSYILPSDALNAMMDDKFGTIQKNTVPEWFFKISVAHEMGHAVVNHFMRHFAAIKNKPHAELPPINVIEFNPRSGGTSASLILNETSNPMNSFETFFGNLASNYACIPAEHYFADGLIDAGMANDLKSNTKHLENAVTLNGMGVKTGAIQPGTFFEAFRNVFDSEIKYDIKHLSDNTLQASYKITKFYLDLIDQYVNKYADVYKNDPGKDKPINETGEDFYRVANKFIFKPGTTEYKDEFKQLANEIEALIKEVHPDYSQSKK